MSPRAAASACARIFRGYGCNSRDVISRWVRALLAGEPINVFRPEGIFDYIYAEDSAEGLIRLAESNVTGIINLGTGRGRRVQEVGRLEADEGGADYRAAALVDHDSGRPAGLPAVEAGSRGPVGRSRR